MSGFVMPANKPARHARTGSASQSWARTSMGSMGSASVLKFPSSNSGKMPTHSESLDPSRVSSGSEDGPPPIKAGRRNSLSAEKALREVQKAMSGVEI
jgi:hypothetical protein